MKTKIAAGLLAIGLLVVACDDGGDATPTPEPAAEGTPVVTEVPAAETVAPVLTEAPAEEPADEPVVTEAPA